MYRGALDTCSHLTDRTYDLVIGSWGDQELPKIAAVGTEAYAYTVLKGTPGSDTPGYVVLDPANPQAYITACAALPRGVRAFLDNCNYGMPGLLAALQIVYPALKAQGRGLCVNAGRPYVAGEDLAAYYGGALWAQWAAQLVPVADRIMLEHWQAVYLNAATTPSGNGETLRPRGTSSWVQYWDQWQLVPKACAGKFVGITYAGAVGLANAIYGRASLLTSGAWGAFIYSTGDGDNTGTTDPYDPAWAKTNPVPVVNPVAPVSASL